MKRTKRNGVSAGRFVEATPVLIAERGGSKGVNRREISKRIGCAHTNVFHYFARFEDLLWAPSRRRWYFMPKPSSEG